MKYNGKFLLGLLALAFLLSCTQTPQQRAKDATVLIIAADTSGNIGTGSGFFVERDKIVTNIHVVDNAKIVFAVGRKKVYNIEKVTGYNPERDLVVLRVSGKGKPLELSEGKIGDPIFAVGYPRGGYDRTAGNVHGIRKSDKQLRLVPEGFPENRDSVIGPGNSGGPLLNGEGQVIGIAVGAAGENFGDAIASSALNPLLDSSNEEDLSDWQKRKPILAYTYYAWADEKVDSGNYKEAIKRFNKANEQYERYAKIYARRGFVKRKLRQYESAIEDHKKEIELIPDNFLAYFRSGITKLNRGSDGDYKAAIEDFNKALELNPDSTSSYGNRGVAKVRLLNYTGAIQDYTDAINRNPKDADTYNNRGFAKLKIEDYTGAIEDYTKAIGLKDDFVIAYFYRGVAKAEMPEPDYVGAIQDYDKVIALNPKDGNAYDYRGKAKKALGQDKDAKIDRAQAYYYRGEANLYHRKYHEAIKQFDESINLNPNYETYYALGDAKQEIGDHKGAIRAYKAAINRKPDYASAYNNLGNTYLLLDDYKVALGHFERAIKEKPELVEAHYNLGETWHHLGNYKEAIKHFDQAIKLTKKPVILAEAYKARAETKEALGKDTDAKLDFAMAYYYRGNEAYGDSKYEEAIKNFDKSLTLSKNLERAKNFRVRAAAYNHLGKIKEKLGKYKADLADLEGARNLYKEAIQNYDEAIKLAAKNDLADYYTNRGWTKFLRGTIRANNEAIEDYKAAIQDFTEVINRKSDLVNTYNLRGTARCLLDYAKANHGQLKEARKQYDLALIDFKEAINLNGDNANYYRGLGLANAALGKAKAAVEAFEKAKQLRAASEKQTN